MIQLYHRITDYHLLNTAKCEKEKRLKVPAIHCDCVNLQSFSGQKPFLLTAIFGNAWLPFLPTCCHR